MELRFCSQCPHESSPPSVIPVLRDLNFLLASVDTRHAYGVCTYRQAKYSTIVLKITLKKELKEWFGW